MAWLTSRVHPAKLRSAIDTAEFGLRHFFGRVQSLPAAHVKPELEKLLHGVGLAAYTAGSEYARSFFPMTKLGYVVEHSYTQLIDQFLAGMDAKLPRSTLDAVQESLESGHGLPREELEGKTGYESAKGVARSVLMNVYVLGALKQWQADGVKHVKRVAMEDNRVCPVCRGLNTKEYSVAFLLTLPNPQNHDTHIGCLVGETMVLAPGARSGFMGRYEGPGIKVVFEGGVITCTANHMFLTPQGFAKASSLREGDDVFYSSRFKRPDGSHPHDDWQPAAIQKVVAALTETAGMSRSRVPVSPEYLHGDGAFMNSHIDVISSDRFVQSAGQAVNGQKSSSLGFQGTSRLSLSSQGLLATELLAMRDASDGGMGIRREGQAFLLRHSAHADEVGFASSSDLHASIEHQLVYHGSRNMELSRQGQRGSPSLIELDNFRNVLVCDSCAQALSLGSISDVNPIALERSSDDFMGNPEPLGDFGNRFSGSISLRKVLRIEHVPLATHVFDLQTESTLYLAEGLVSSNCRCSLVPIINISTQSRGGPIHADFRRDVRVGKNEARAVPIEYVNVLEEALRGSELPFKVKFDPKLKSDYELKGGTLSIHPKTLADEDPREIIFAEAAELLWDKNKDRVEKEYRPLVEAGYARSVRSWDSAKELFTQNYTGWRLGQLDEDLWSQVFFRSLAN